MDPEDMLRLEVLILETWTLLLEGLIVDVGLWRALLSEFKLKKCIYLDYQEGKDSWDK